MIALDNFKRYFGADGDYTHTALTITYNYTT